MCINDRTPNWEHRLIQEFRLHISKIVEGDDDLPPIPAWQAYLHGPEFIKDTGQEVSQ